MALDLNVCTEDCFNCIKKYKKKHTLKKGQEFEIRCRGIPKNFVADNITVKDKDMARVLMDPVAWAAETLDWHCLDPDGEVWKRKNPDEYYAWLEDNPGVSILGHSRYHRPYQATMLRCSSKRKVFRIGRQCLTGNTFLHLENGKLVRLQDVTISDTTFSLHENNKITTNTITNFVNQGKKQTFLLKTKFGHVVQCTDDHEFYCIAENIDKYHGITADQLPRQWLSIKDGLKKGYKIACAEFINSFGNQSIGNLAPFLGYFLTDGSCSINQSAKFTNTNIDYLNEFASLSRDLGSSVKWYTKGNGYDLIISNGRSAVNPVRDILQTLKLTNIKGPEKYIPDCIFTAPKEEIRLFLNRFWAGDGYISTFQRTGRKTFRTEIGTLQESKLLLEQLQQLLYRFGCHGYISQEGNCYRYVISNKVSIENFLQEIGPIFGKEVSCKKAKDNLANLSDSFVNRTEDILWDYITSIEKATVEPVYDIEIDGTHNFIANGIIAHNCGKTEGLVISILYNLFLKPGVPEEEGLKVIVITPYQAQIDLIFTRIKQLIKGSPVAQNSIRRDVKAPIYTIELHNNSVVRGFTAGTKSGGNAEAVRGQTGHMLVFDEADYLSAGDMDAAMSIITNYPNATLWMSSTPSGKRERFYQTCLSKRFKEYHFSSQVNPMWNKHLEADFREQLTEIGYKHEVLADFGEQEEGVFQNVYVQAAKNDEYNYGDLPYYHTWTYTMGVDWNDTANGTTINILGFDPTRNKFIVVDRKVVSREGWTQTSAMLKIAELNRIWRPMAIYIDAGHGGTQWEMLRKFGYDSLIDPTKGPTHPDARLRDIVKKYDFGSKVETRDPFTKQKLNKPAKPFLVESTVRRFESKDIEFPASDTSLEDQLLGYIIDRVTQSGVPVYKAGNETAGDHALDALMLSVLAFVMEVSPIGKPKFDIGIAFSGQFGEKLDALVHEGDTVITADNRKRKAKEHREHTKPDSGRDKFGVEYSLTSTQGQLPANNIQQPQQVGLWSWPGFMRDEPAPRVRTLAEAKSDVRRRLGLIPRRGGRPVRKKI